MRERVYYMLIGTSLCALNVHLHIEFNAYLMELCDCADIRRHPIFVLPHSAIASRIQEEGLVLLEEET